MKCLPYNNENVPRMPRFLENVCFAKSCVRTGSIYTNGCLERERIHIKEHYRAVLFKHMFAEHNFNIGLPDNLVNVNEFLELLENKLSK